MLSALFVFSLLAAPALSAPVPIPNGSFEDPALPLLPPYASPTISAWQKSPVPSWWTQAGYTADQWNDSAGTFVNVNIPGDYIDNCDGNQAAFMFAPAPGYGLYQDLSATYQAGQSYQLTVAIEGGGYGMPVGFQMEIGLYYRDGNGNQVPVGTTTVTNTNTGNLTHLTDYSASIPAVAATDPWAGQSVGVELLQTESGTGYWDIDNVRLTTAAVPEPGSLALLAVAFGMFSARRWRAAKK
jgi:hypothetical protein